jgi:carboxymethylenebutenolidase
MWGGIERMRAACTGAGKTCEIIVYPQAGHAFDAAYRPSYRPEAAKEGWARMLASLRTYGVA